jgi:hypothetical protein
VSDVLPHDHPEFEVLRRFARWAVIEAMELADGSSSPDADGAPPGQSQRVQAFHYAVQALVNEMRFAGPGSEELAIALGAALGALACHVQADELKPFMETIGGQATLTISAARGEAPPSRRGDA